MLCRKRVGTREGGSKGGTGYLYNKQYFTNIFERIIASAFP